jgi:choline kinase
VRAIILAAGRGGRLRGIAGDRPKCLVRVGPLTLLERQIAALRACGVWPITVVVGYRADEVRRIVGTRVDVVCNERFDTTNSLYSLWLAREYLAGRVMVLNCDVLFHVQMLADLITAQYGDALLVAARAADQRYGAEEMKVCIRAGRVTAIAKTIASDAADAENVGIAKFSGDGTALLVDELHHAVSNGGVRKWLPSAFATFARRRPLYAIDTRGLPWIEIDTPDDYWRASAVVLPAIESMDGGARPSHAGGQAFRGSLWRPS